MPHLDEPQSSSNALRYSLSSIPQVRRACFSVGRFTYDRSPKNVGFDLTKIGWPASFNSVIPAIMRTPPTPAFPFPNDVGKSQGNSAIGDHNTQYNISPSLTVIRGKHTFQAGVQYELGLDNYFQTNIASGAFGFSGAQVEFAHA